MGSLENFDVVNRGSGQEVMAWVPPRTVMTDMGTAVIEGNGAGGGAADGVVVGARKTGCFRRSGGHRH